MNLVNKAKFSMEVITITSYYKADIKANSFSFSDLNSRRANRNFSG